MSPSEPNPQSPNGRSRRRRGLVYGAAALGTAVLLLLLWKPIIAWFTGKPMGGGTSESVSSRMGSLTVDAALRPDPPRQEGNSLLLTVRGPDGEPVEEARVEVGVRMPAMGAMPEMRGKADIAEEGNGRYRADFDLQMAGTWTVEVDIESPAGSASPRYTLTVGSNGLTPVGSAGGGASAGASGPVLAPRDLPEASLAPLRTAFAAYEEARALLAKDRLDGLQARAGRLAQSLAAARQSFAEGDQDVLRWLEEGERAAGRLGAARSLDAARKAFSEVSRTLIGLAQCDPRLTQGLHLFSCPMTPGFNRWMQRSPEVENPYMGTAMQSCGSAEEWTPLAAGATAGGDQISHYTCSMHPSVRKEGPGTCPICNMDLVPVTREQAASGEVVIAPEQQRLIGVRSSLVETRPVESEVRAVGRVAFDETRFEDVTVKYGGYIGRLHVEETGQPVRKGQTLFTLYSPELYAAQQEYLIALASQRAARGTSAPDRADYLVQAARQKLRLWDLSESQVRTLASRGRPAREVAVPSPASGYVVEKDVVEGAAVQPGMRLFRIAALDRVWVEAEVYESELPRVRLGQRATVTLPYLPGPELNGRVRLILPALNPESRTGRVRIEIANRSGAGGPMLRPDMYADVVLQSRERDALMVPESAVLFTGVRRLVFLDLGEGRFRPKEVQLGARSRDFYEVIAGLQEGDRVVTSGNFLVDAEARLRTGGQAGGGDHAGH